MGRSYWNTGESYKQPDASQLQRNARQTMKKEKAKENTIIAINIIK